MTEISEELMAKIAKELKKLSFGELVVTIHASRVVQMEIRRKERFPRPE